MQKWHALQFSGGSQTLKKNINKSSRRMKMNKEIIEEKIYACLEITEAKEEIHNIEKQIVDLHDRIELLIAPDYYAEFMRIYLQQEELSLKRDHLEFMEIYKAAFKDGVVFGMGLDV
jgi:hypothetical protein